jgi:hypothetical protein
VEGAPLAHPENCLTCGFLTLRGQEYLAIDREALSPERAPAEAVHLRCYLELWDDVRPERGLPDVIREAHAVRTCAGHLTHQPGQSPKQHLVISVQRHRRRPRWQMPTVVGILLVVGAFFARSCLS